VYGVKILARLVQFQVRHSNRKSSLPSIFILMNYFTIKHAIMSGFFASVEFVVLTSIRQVPADGNKSKAENVNCCHCLSSPVCLFLLLCMSLPILYWHYLVA